MQRPLLLLTQSASLSQYLLHGEGLKTSLSSSSGSARTRLVEMMVRRMIRGKNIILTQRRSWDWGGGADRGCFMDSLQCVGFMYCYVEIMIVFIGSYLVTDGILCSIKQIPRQKWKGTQNSKLNLYIGFGLLITTVKNNTPSHLQTRTFKFLGLVASWIFFYYCFSETF